MSGIATAIFSIRNYGKANRGDSGRLPAAIAQTTNSAGQAINSIIDKVDDLGRWAEVGTKVGEKAARVSRLASKITNPLLVGAAGYRVIKDEDRESALVEEGLAMSGMFAGERMYKIVRNTIDQSAGKTLKESQKVLKNKTITNQLEKVGKKVSELSKGKQRALFILAEIGLVATSIICYDLAKKVGKALTGRNKEQVKEIQKTQDTKTENVKTLDMEA